MTTVTVGQIAGVISFAVLLSSVILPLMIIAILVGFLREKNSAVTWSVVCRFVQGTWWPTLLRSDSTAWHGVDRKVLYLTISSTVSVLVLGLAGVITPLGLDEGIVATTRANLPFDIFEDHSIIGLGTMDREGYEYTRLCGNPYLIACPSQEYPKGVTFNANSREFETEDPEAFFGDITVEASSKIPTNLTEAFQVPKDFSSHNTIAGPFDVQYRSFKKVIDQSPFKDLNVTETVVIDSRKPYVAPDYRAFGHNALKSEYQVIEGGIVDRINGGYGFLNHTAPRGTQYRSEWEVDVLWIEPESVCVPNNVSIVYTYGDRSTGLQKFPIMTEVSIRDYGGLKDLPLEYPILDLNRSQDDPQLWARAWKAAVITNFNIYGPLGLKRPDIPKTKETMSYNVTAYLSEKFTLQPDLPFVQRFGASMGNGLLPLFGDMVEGRVNTSNSVINPDTASRGFGGGDQVGIQTIHSDSYFLITPGIPLPGWSPGHQRKDPGTRWEHKIYTCATALTASIKEIAFSFNVTNRTISVLNVSNLPQTKPTPLWGMENPGWNVSQVQPIWGVVSENAKNNPALSVIQKDKFYLPAGAASLEGDLLGSIALPTVAISALYRLFEVFNRATTGTYSTDYGSYSGAANYEAYQRWYNTTGNSDTAWQMIHVIWADIMGNLAMSTNSIPSDDTLPVMVWERRILYDIKFAIPAFIFLAIFLVLMGWLLLLVVTKKTSIENVRQVVNMTGTGRAITNIQSPGIVAASASTQDWVRSAGKEVIRVPYRTKHKEYDGMEEGREESHVYRPAEKYAPEVQGREDSSNWQG